MSYKTDARLTVMQRSTIDNNTLRQLLFIAIILFLGIILFRELFFFISAFLGSVTFYVLMRERMFFLTEKKKWNKTRAAWTLMLLSFFIILVPIGLLGNIIYSKVSYVVTHSVELLDSLKKTIYEIRSKIGYELIDPNAINQIGPYLAQLLPRVLNITLNTITLIASMYFILFFMLINGRKMEAALYNYIPLKETNVERIGKELKNMVISNTIGIPLIALIQGVVGLIGYYIIGVRDPWLWFAATTIASMLPVIGAALVYVPLSIMLFAQGESGKGIAMLLWGLGLISLSDNFFRMLFNRKLGDIHPIITVFGVVIGVQLFGFIGLIFGPLLISMFLLLISIYSSEFKNEKRP